MKRFGRINTGKKIEDKKPSYYLERACINILEPQSILHNIVSSIFFLGWAWALAFEVPARPIQAQTFRSFSV